MNYKDSIQDIDRQATLVEVLGILGLIIVIALAAFLSYYPLEIQTENGIIRQNIFQLFLSQDE